MNNFDGYYESESTTQSRAWRIALESVGYVPTLHTEAEADALANLIDVADPRSDSERVRDEWDAEWQETYRTLQP